MTNKIAKLFTFKNSEQCSLFLIKYLLFIIFLSACAKQEQQQIHVFSGPMMGTNYRITVVVDSALDEDLLHKDALSAMENVNQSMSTYIETSEINAINRLVANKKMNVSKPLMEVLQYAQQVSQLSDGAFDITLGPLINLWGFGEDGRINKQPSGQAVEAVAPTIGYKNLTLTDEALTKSHAATQLNVSAIAKGYAVDKVAESLERNGVSDFLIDIGGELRAAGQNIDQEVWSVGIEKPQLTGGVQEVIRLANKAVATSGDYLNFILIDEQRYSHTINPKTMAPVLHKLALVSVIHDNATMADALATAMMAMGEERAWVFAQEQSLAAYFTIRSGDGAGFENRYTPSFAEFIESDY